MISPKEYKVKEQVTKHQLENAAFINKSDYYVMHHSLYKNGLINLFLMIDKDDRHMIINVNDNNNEIYAPFYNPDLRYNNLVAKEVIENFNRFMDKLVQKGVLVYEYKVHEDNNIVQNGKEEMKAIKIKYVSDIDKIKTFCNGDWIDLRAAETVQMKAGEFKLISLGVVMQLPDGYEAHIVPRSSTYKNFGIIQTNHQAVIDNSYCGENDIWKYPAYAIRDTVIKKNDRICQFRIVKNQPPIIFEEVRHMTNKDRGGIGSTGKN